MKSLPFYHYIQALPLLTVMLAGFLAPSALQAKDSSPVISKTASAPNKQASEPEVLSDTEIANVLLKRGRPIRLIKENGLPLVCNVNFDIVSIIKVDEAKEMFEIDFYTWVAWKDSRLAFDPKEFGVDRINVYPAIAWDSDRLWNPMIEFMNLADQKITDQSLRIESNGYCRWTVRQTASFKLPEDEALRRFPFDRMNLPIIIGSFRWDINHILFSFEDGNRELKRSEVQNLDTSEWRILGGKAEVLKEVWKDDPSPWSIAVFSLSIQRLPGYYLWKVCLPLLLIVLLAMSVPWLSHHELEARTCISLTCLVAICTYSIVVNADLPKVSFLTLLDLWMIINIIIVALGGIENVAVAYFVRKNKHKEQFAVRMDHFCRIAFPFFYIVTTIILACFFR